MRCKRFLNVIKDGTYYCRADSKLANSFQFFVPTGVPMRADPSVSGTPVIYSLSNSANATQQSGFTFSYKTLSSGFIRIIATKNNHGLSDAILELPVDFRFIAQL